VSTTPDCRLVGRFQSVEDFIPPSGGNLKPATGGLNQSCGWLQPSFSPPSVLAICFNEPLLRTWRGHSCQQRGHSCRRRRVGHAFSLSSRVSVDLHEGISAVSGRPALKRRSPRKFVEYREFGLKGRLHVRLPSPRKAKVEQWLQRAVRGRRIKIRRRLKPTPRKGRSTRDVH
jgi:hypothetical protein